MEEQAYSYPWLRNLFLVVLYVSALIFLWHFPLEGVRQFVQELFRGCGYLLAGLLLGGITLLLLLSLVPSLPSEEEEIEEEGAAWRSEEAFDEFNELGLPPEGLELFLGVEDGVGLTEGYAIGVPALADSQQADHIWEILYQVQEQFDERGTIIVDQGTGVVTLSSPDGNRDLFRAVKKELRKAHIQTRKPGS